MSKATEWVQQHADVEQRWRDLAFAVNRAAQWCDASARLTAGVETHVSFGVGARIRTLSSSSLAPPEVWISADEAIKLARWILDVFAEPGS